MSIRRFFACSTAFFGALLIPNDPSQIAPAILVAAFCICLAMAREPK